MPTKNPAVELQINYGCNCSILLYIHCSFYDRVCMYCIITYVAVLFHQVYFPSRKSLFQELKNIQRKTIHRLKAKGTFPQLRPSDNKRDHSLQLSLAQGILPEATTGLGIVPFAQRDISHQ